MQGDAAYLAIREWNKLWIRLDVQAHTEDVPEIYVPDVGKVQEDDSADDVDGCNADCGRHAFRHIPRVRHIRAVHLQPSSVSAKTSD